MAFRHQIAELSGHDVNLCYQCSKCSSGCPMADWMDLKTAQVMHSIRLGRLDSVLNSKAIWLCVGCETCTQRCPQKAEPAAAMNACRTLALQLGFKPSVKEIGIYYKAFVDNMRLNGKIHDASVVAITGLLSGTIFNDLPLAFKLFQRGRLKLPPLPTGGKAFRKMYAEIMSREKESRQ